MDALLLTIVVFMGYIVMYNFYGKYIGNRVFKLASDTEAPSKALEDGIDFVPTKKEIIFGHHYTSIAGTGPIVGPAIAIIWGWVPAIIWVFLGSVIYFQGGFLFPNTGAFAWQPYVTVTHNSIDALNDSRTDFGIGLNSLITGHHAKLSLEYRSFNAVAGDSSGRLILQAVVFL